MTDNEQFLTTFREFISRPPSPSFETTDQRGDVLLSRGDLVARLEGSGLDVGFKKQYFSLKSATPDQTEQYTAMRVDLVRSLPLDAWRLFATATLADDSVSFDVDADMLECTFQCHCCEDCMLSDSWRLRRSNKGAYVLDAAHYVKCGDRWASILESAENENKSHWVKVNVPLAMDYALVLSELAQTHMDAEAKRAVQAASEFKQDLDALMQKNNGTLQ